MKPGLGSVMQALLVVGLLVFIMYISAWVRMGTIDSKTVSDYDPHWYYRHALEIMANNYLPPKWDILSFYPPGRPFYQTPGWEYIMIFFYKVAQLFSQTVTFLTVAKWSPIIMVALGVVPAFLMGRLISNNWGGLVTALLAVLSPTFIGVSMAAYTDNDPIVVFYMFFVTLAIIMALKRCSVSIKPHEHAATFPLFTAALFSMFRFDKSALAYLALAVAANVLFAFAWGGGWLPALFFVLFLPALFVFRLVEQFVHTFKLKFDLREPFYEVIRIGVPLVLVVVSSNIIAAVFGLPTMLDSVLIALDFIGGVGGLIVNISVAELQNINILSLQGFLTIVGRVGLLPTISTIIGLPLFIIFKLYRKEKANFMEVFLFIWAIASFLSILRGTRFSLEFETAAAATTGYIVGSMVNYLKGRTAILGSAFFGVVILFLVMFVSDAVQIGKASAGMTISDNWYSALDWLKANGNSSTLVVTWWDPGHIIADLTGLKVMADGAHCAPSECIPYNHNARIQDMGAAFSTSRENNSIAILRNYVSLTAGQCGEARRKFGGIMPENACNPVSKMYVLATSDLIGKYYWLSYFGSCINKYGVGNMDFCHKLSLDEFKKTAEGRNYMQCGFDQQLSQQLGAYSYACQSYAPAAISLVQKNSSLAAVMNSPQQGVRNVPIRDVLLFQNGAPLVFDYSNSTGAIDGLAFIDPGLRSVIFMDAQIRDSVFTNMFFFNGEGNVQMRIPRLDNFRLVYSNAEVRIFEVAL